MHILLAMSVLAKDDNYNNEENNGKNYESNHSNDSKALQKGLREEERMH